MTTSNVLPAIARRVIRLAHRATSCTCDESRVRWDLDQACAFIDHLPTCPLAKLGRLEEAA